MKSTLAERLDGLHPQMLRAEGESDPQALGKRLIGRALERALERASITKQAAAFDMGYSDSGVIGRWIAGTETPQFAKLWGLGEKFQRELVIALAEEAKGIDIVTELRVAR